MKQYRIYLILIAVLGIVAAYFILNNKKGTLQVESNYFAITDTSEISRITIQKGISTVVLELVGENWMVNGKYNANTRLVRAILGAMQGLEIKSPVPNSIYKDVSRSFTNHCIHLTFETSIKVVKDFEICDLDSFHLGTFIRDFTKKDIYVSQLPGFQNRITDLFSVKENVWRDNVIFRYKPWEILSINVSYPANISNSFSIDLSSPEKITLNNFNNSKSKLIKKDEIVRYLMNFNLVPCEFVTNRSRIVLDSLKKNSAFCNITVKNIANQDNNISFYTKAGNGSDGKSDLFKMYAVLQNDTLPVIIKYTDIDPITKTYSELTEK
jgi:hypothetical protein